MADLVRTASPSAVIDAPLSGRALRPSPRSITVAALAVVALSASWNFVLPALGVQMSDFMAELVQGCFNLTLQAVGVVVVFRGASRQTGRRRTAWMTIGLGALVGAIGTAVWSVMLAGTQEHPSGAVDMLYALALFLTTAGVAMLPPSDQRSRRVRMVDTAILMLAALTLVWVTPVHQQIDGRVIAGFPTISVFEIVTVATILVAVGTLARCRPDRHGEIGLMAGALTCSGVGMLLYASAPEGYPTASRLGDCVFALGFVLAAAAGLRLSGPTRAPRRRGSDRGRHWFALPEVATVTTLVALTLHERVDDDQIASLALGSAAVVLAFARLVQLGMEQRRLSRSLHESADLLYREARTDTLTGLGNRLALDEHLRTSLDRERRQPVAERAPLAVMFIDIDHFKRFNDALGHAVGDGLLAEVARRIVRTVGQHAYRIGGDEFVAVVGGPDARRARELASELIAAFDTPVVVDDHEMAATVSVGAASWDDDLAEVPDAADLIRQADLALYRSKELGRGRWAAFDPSIAERAELQHRLRQGLQRAAELDELEVHFEPVASLSDRRLLGATARLHWRSELGLLGPEIIGPVAVEGGLVAPTAAVLFDEIHRTLVETRDLRTDGRDAPLWIGVHLARDELVHPATSEVIIRCLDDPRVTPSRLRIDITEDTVVDDTAIEVIAALRQLGVGLTVDRFGTGPSSLLRLSHYPASSIRVDRSFVHGLGRRRGDTVIVTAVAGLAADLGLELSADGIDEEFQAEYLEGLGFTSGRGRLFGERVPRDVLCSAAPGRQEAAR